MKLAVPLLPKGSLRTAGDVRKILAEYSSEVEIAKSKELEGYSQLVEKYSPKKPLQDLKISDKNWLIRAARDKARKAKRSDRQLESDYDSAHGPYMRIPCLSATPCKQIDRRSLEAALARHYSAQGYIALPEGSENADGNTADVGITISSELYLLYGVGSDLACKLSDTYGPVLCMGRPDYWGREGWTYFLYEHGSETDRHTPTPFLLETINNLVAENDDPVQIRRLCVAWSGRADFLARAFGVSAEAVMPYLLQFEMKELQKIWDERGLFIELKGFDDDRYSLASPWANVDLLRRLGGGTTIYDPPEMTHHRFIKKG